MAMTCFQAFTGPASLLGARGRSKSLRAPAPLGDFFCALMDQTPVVSIEAGEICLTLTLPTLSRLILKVKHVPLSQPITAVDSPLRIEALQSVKIGLAHEREADQVAGH